MTVLKCDAAKVFRYFNIRRTRHREYAACVTKRDTFVTVGHNYEKK